MAISSLSVQKLTNRHRLMMDALVFRGLTGNEVCEEFGIVASRLSVLRNSPLWIEEEADLREEFLKSTLSGIQTAMPDAVQALKDTVVHTHVQVGENGQKTITHNTPETRIRSAREILDRGGIFKKEVVKPMIQIGKIDSLKIDLKENNNRRDAILGELNMTEAELIADVVILTEDEDFKTETVEDTTTEIDIKPESKPEEGIWWESLLSE